MAFEQASTSELAEAIGITDRTIRKVISELKTEGVVLEVIDFSDIRKKKYEVVSDGK